VRGDADNARDRLRGDNEFVVFPNARANEENEKSVGDGADGGLDKFPITGGRGERRDE